MGYVGVPPQSGFITTAKQRVTSSTNNYVDLDHSISSLADVIVWVNFVKQDSTNLSLTTSTRITLGGTLVSSDIVEIAYLGKAVATQTPDTGTVTNDMLAGSIANSKLANSSVSINGSTLALGGSLTGIGEDNTPYFLACGTGTQSLTEDQNTTIQYNTLRDSLDSASGYNTSTYTYTVQSGGAGFWYLAAGNYVQNISQDKQVDIQIHIAGSEFFVSRHKPGNSIHQFLQVFGIQKLAVGNTVLVKIGHNDNSARNAVNNGNNSFFGGFRIKSL
jgi:hypothetical protein